MRTLIFIVFYLLTSNTFAQKTPKALLVLLDGIPADVIEKTYTPNIDLVSKDGGYNRAYVGGEKEAYSETPTISAVSYNTMLTGTWVNKHNVWGNDLKEPNYNFPTIFKLMREAKPQSKLAIYSTWTDNRTKLLGEGLPQTSHLKLDFTKDGYELDKLRFPHDNNSDYINKIDEEVVKEAAWGIKNDAPDLGWVYLQYTDDIGHKYGADTEEMKIAIQKADRQIGELYQAIKYRQLYHNEDWMIIIVTDHGRDAATGKSHGGQSARERTIWISTNKKELNKYFYTHQPAMVDILPSVCRHLEINIPKQYSQELDGIPFIGKISVVDFTATLNNHQLNLNWTPFETSGTVEVFVSSTNHFKTSGIADSYQSLGTFDVKLGKATISLPPKFSDSKFLKILIEGQHNSLNKWIIR